jgi:hypothetical protein
MGKPQGGNGLLHKAGLDNAWSDGAAIEENACESVRKISVVV